MGGRTALPPLSLSAPPPWWSPDGYILGTTCREAVFTPAALKHAEVAVPHYVVSLRVACAVSVTQLRGEMYGVVWSVPTIGGTLHPPYILCGAYYLPMYSMHHVMVCTI